MLTRAVRAIMRGVRRSVACLWSRRAHEANVRCDIDATTTARGDKMMQRCKSQHCVAWTVVLPRLSASLYGALHQVHVPGLRESLLTKLRSGAVDMSAPEPMQLLCAHVLFGVLIARFALRCALPLDKQRNFARKASGVLNFTCELRRKRHATLQVGGVMNSAKLLVLLWSATAVRTTVGSSGRAQACEFEASNF